MFHKLIKFLSTDDIPKTMQKISILELESSDYLLYSLIKLTWNLK
jgi:hypothetical protein